MNSYNHGSFQEQMCPDSGLISGEAERQSVSCDRWLRQSRSLTPRPFETNARVTSKENVVKKIAYLLSAICLSVLSVSAKADTLKLVSTNTGSTGPYQLLLNGTTPVNLFCMDDFREISIGQTWGVTVVNGADYLNSNTHSTDFKYEQEAYIYSKLGTKDNGHTYTTTDVQQALWYIFDHDANTNSHAEALVSASRNFSYTSSFLDDFSFYIPTGSGHNLPQEMIGSVIPPAQAPEPSTLLLMGSGLVGLAGAVRRRFVRS